MPTATTVDGVSIAVHDLGGSGPPLLMAHATGLHGRVWEPVASELAGRFHCVAFDERGHGDSGLPPGLDFEWRGIRPGGLCPVDETGIPPPLPTGAPTRWGALL